MEILKDVLSTFFYVLLLDQVVFKYTSTEITGENPHLVDHLSGLDSFFLAFYHVQIFGIKYIIFYRFGGIFAKLNGHTPPGTPKCTQMTLTFTDMWRTFDQGLYKILQKNIYFPMGGSRRGIPMQLLSSFFCFLFVAFWHGGNRTNFIVWGLLNWLGVIIESIGRILRRRLETKEFMRHNKRVSSFFLTITGFPLIFSNLVFLIDIESTKILLKNIFRGWKDSFPVFGVIFLAGHMIFEIEEIRNKKPREKKKIY